jgi:hypothetical protein
MNAASHPFEIDVTDPTGERFRRHAEVLEELAELGMVMARMLRGQVSEALKHQERVDAAAVSTAFGRVSRSVRQSLALEDKLAEHHATRGERIRRALREADGFPGALLDPAPPPAAAEVSEEWLVPTRKAAVGHAVADILRADRETREAPEQDDERLLSDIYERLDAFEDLDFKTRTVGEIAGMICDDLKVMVDWPHWRASAWAELEIWEKNPRSPFFRTGSGVEAGAGRAPIRDRGPP